MPRDVEALKVRPEFSPFILLAGSICFRLANILGLVCGITNGVRSSSNEVIILRGSNPSVRPFPWRILHYSTIVEPFNHLKFITQRGMCRPIFLSDGLGNFGEPQGIYTINYALGLLDFSPKICLDSSEHW